MIIRIVTFALFVISTAGQAQMTWGPGQRMRDTLFVMGRPFELPQRDSALVLMLDAPTSDTTGSPSLLELAWVPADLDQRFWSKSWTSGDTTYMVRPRGERSILRDALLQSPRVRSYLLRTP